MFSLALTARTHARKSRDLEVLAPLFRFVILWTTFQRKRLSNQSPRRHVCQAISRSRQTDKTSTDWAPTEFSSSNSFRFFTFFFLRADGLTTNGLLGKMLSRPLWIWASDLVASGTTELLCSYYPLGLWSFFSTLSQQKDRRFLLSSFLCFCEEVMVFFWSDLQLWESNPKISLDVKRFLSPLYSDFIYKVLNEFL